MQFGKKKCNGIVSGRPGGLINVGYPRTLLELLVGLESYVGRTFELFAKIVNPRKGTNCVERLAAWICTIRCESTREKSRSFRDKNEGTYRSGEGGEEPAYSSDPGSELRLGRDKERGRVRR